jgi:ankyrin repeat protein
MLAAKRRKAEVVKLLLEIGVDPISGSREPQQQPPREPPLMLACQQGHFETVSAFMPFLGESWMLQFGLYWAARAGKPELVKIFLEQPGIDINAHVGKETALYAACGSCPPPTIEMLLKAGADPSVFCADSPYSNVLMEPESVGGAFELERNSFHNLHRNIVASWRYQEEWLSEGALQSILTLFIEAGVDINQPDTNDKTALHLAVENRGLEVARVLLDAGARVDARDDEGQTPLHKALGGDMISLLVEHGHASLDTMDNEGRTPLQLAFARFDLGAGVMTLLEYGGDFNATDASGNTILHVAVKSTSRERTIPQVLRDLLDRGVDPNRKNHDGLAPLLVAGGQRYRSLKRTQVIDVLLEAGADINSTDNGGSTVLFRALQELVNAPPQHQPLPVLTPLILGLIERGASIHARDVGGRTLLHEAIKIMALPNDDIHERVNIPVLSFLSSLGLDLKAVDNDGNSLLHELASRNVANSLNRNPSYGGGVPVWKWLVKQGLGLHSKNVAGRTPLHILCKTVWNENLALVTKWVPFYFVVSETNDLNSPDMYGLYPLHVAATTNPRYARALLEAGADPTVVTHEGLTPLHLAARSRQSNVVGMLLDALEKRGGVLSDDNSVRHGPRFQLPRDAATKPIPGVDATAYGSNSHITPLFFACQSGRPETVALLLAAGASVRSAFQGCLGFAAEDRLWKDPDQLGRVGYEFRGDAAGVRIDDASRPRVGVGAGNTNYSETPNSNTRMEEILEMLAQHGANLSPHQGPLEALAYRIYKGAAYKPSDPDDVRDRRAEESRLTITKYLDHENVTSKKAAISALKELHESRPDLLNEDLFYHLLAEKQYHLVEELSMLGKSFLTAEIGVRSNFRSLVSQGFTQLVERIGAMEAENAMKNGGVWHAFGQPTRPGLWCSQRKPSEAAPNAFYRPGFFLRDAVGRELPNLDVVKLLVERFGVDIDEVQPTEIYADISSWDFPTDSALHLLAQGKNWWHVHQALPYLLQAGAKVDVRDGNGRTPLHLALVSDGAFSGDAATRLLDAGADMNAVDEMGKSCFDHAWRNGDKMKLLLDHGASVGADTVQAAIHAHDPVILETLLSSRPELASADTLTEEDSALSKDRNPPLLQACWHVSGSPAKLAEDEAAIEVVKVLLRHGADPLAKFSQKLPRESRTNPVPRRGPHTVQERIDEANAAKYREATILHELLFQKDYVDCLLDTPGLDLNHRDSEGCTLLQTVFQIPRSSGRPPPESKSELPSEIATRVFLRLISLGADIEACDDQGRNVLHHMFFSGDEKGKDFSFYRDALSKVLRIAPNLINQPDNAGRTPLREAVVHAAKRRDPEIADLLFQHGGNPLDHDADGNSLLHVLARKLDDEATRSLFRRLVTGSPGIDVNTRNKRGETPLFPFAARLVAEYSPKYRNSLVVEKAAITMLQGLGADFHAKDNEGRGLLHVAAQGETLRFKQLLDLGLDALMEDNAHQTPIDVAAAKGNTKILELFEKDKK